LALATRSCFTALLLCVVLPTAGLVIAAWLFLVPTPSEAEAANAYRKAPVCTTSSAAECIYVEQAVVVDVFSTAGRLASRTDTFRLRLADGEHLTNIYFDIFAPDVYFAPAGGELRVREFRGLVTTIYSADGKGWETGDSPNGGSSWRGGAGAVLVIVSAPVLFIALVLVRGFGLKWIWRLLKDPNKHPSIYPDHLAARDSQ
jgi:hypothetical protein